MTSKSKKRNKKKSVHSGKRAFSDQRGNNTPCLELYSYSITNEPINEASVPDEVKAEMGNIFENLQKAPETIIDKIEEFISKYPNVPQLYNFASVAYSHLNDAKKARYYTEKNIENNHDYLFAKLNYAEICMNEGKHEKVAEIFGNKFELQALYPTRNVFHITEVVGFMGITATYFAHMGMAAQVELLYNSLVELAPSHPYTQRIRNYLIKEKVKHPFRMLMGKK